jgi:stearoyl-CoA desaturase (delta-9 desaturase)
MQTSVVDKGDSGVIQSGPQVGANRILNAVSVGLPAVGFILGLAMLPDATPSALTVLLSAVFLLLGAFGVTLGLHRLFTHRSYQARPMVRVVLGVLGTWAFQGPVERWVADHRRHHRFTDQALDPHSPWINSRGPIRNRFLGFLHSHFLWMLTAHYTDPARYAPDIRSDPVARWLTRYYWPIALSGLLIPALLGLLLGGADEASRCLVWAGCFRVMTTHQLTWAVNSFGHMMGSSHPEAAHEARNNNALALLLLGEGLHAWHHAHPRSAINKPSNRDASGAILRLLERSGLVKIHQSGSGQRPSDDCGTPSHPERRVDHCG